VIPDFANKILELQNLGLVPTDSSHKFMAIAWRKHLVDNDKIALSDYWTNFSHSEAKIQQDFIVLEDYITQFDKEKKTLETLRKNILNALLKILRLECVYDDNRRVYTKRKLINYFKALESHDYETLKLNLYQWSINSIRGKTEEVVESIISYIPSFLQVFEESINYSNGFINDKSSIIESKGSIEVKSNCYQTEGLKVDLGSVHSTKGQTHTATLYLESYYYNDGGKSYESQRLSNQILGVQIPKNAKKRVKQSSKMAYVGFSRPTHLLCLAVHKSRFESVLSAIDRNLWDVIEVKT
jgi:hypothetical protein